MCDTIPYHGVEVECAFVHFFFFCKLYDWLALVIGVTSTRTSITSDLDRITRLVAHHIFSPTSLDVVQFIKKASGFLAFRL